MLAWETTNFVDSHNSMTQPQNVIVSKHTTKSRSDALYISAKVRKTSTTLQGSRPRDAGRTNSFDALRPHPAPSSSSGFKVPGSFSACSDLCSFKSIWRCVMWAAMYSFHASSMKSSATGPQPRNKSKSSIRGRTTLRPNACLSCSVRRIRRSPAPRLKMIVGRIRPAIESRCRQIRTDCG